MSDVLDDIYNAFDPFRPLPAGDPAYVDCQDVRGDNNVLIDLGRGLTRSRQLTYQLYSGHRGAGKSTELLRLKADLESKGFFVVYFAADEQDTNSEDTEYTDILLACTRHLLEELRSVNSKPVMDWVKSRLDELKDLALMDVSADNLNAEVQLAIFAKLTANVRTEPTQRQRIRQKINPYTTTLIEALNEFIANAQKKLPNNKSQLVVIADNLDRIVPFSQDSGRSNHEEIYLDRSEQLKALKCHTIYTVPISMVYSKWANDLKTNYGNIQVLPMIMVQDQHGKPCDEGLMKMKDIIARRIKPYAPDLELDSQVFDSPDTLKKLCLMSGGHIRELMLLAQEAVNRTDQLPISAKAVQRAITELRNNVYRRTVEEDQWTVLAKVSQTKDIQNDNQHRSLLFNRCLLEYRYLDNQGELSTWYDVHPLIKDLPQFQNAVDTLKL
ncbi:MAG: ATP-binding protein [Elainellaceae cyanobacterium]